MPIPTPEAGLVISYSYLWHFEHRAGQDEGRKTRPAAIVLTAQREVDDSLVVTVLPITHSAPTDPLTAIEIPAPIKRHLGLDEERSWIVLNEGNEFDWPGYDLRKVPNADRYDYGFLPRRFFATVITAFVAWHKLHKGQLIPRAQLLSRGILKSVRLRYVSISPVATRLPLPASRKTPALAIIRYSSWPSIGP